MCKVSPYRETHEHAGFANRCVSNQEHLKLVFAMIDMNGAELAEVLRMIAGSYLGSYSMRAIEKEEEELIEWCVGN